MLIHLEISPLTLQVTLWCLSAVIAFAAYLRDKANRPQLAVARKERRKRSRRRG